MLSSVQPQDLPFLADFLLYKHSVLLWVISHASEHTGSSVYCRVHTHPGKTLIYNDILEYTGKLPLSLKSHGKQYFVFECSLKICYLKSGPLATNMPLWLFSVYVHCFVEFRGHVDHETEWLNAISILHLLGPFATRILNMSMIRGDI